MARWMRAAATEESTPPERAQTTLPLAPTWARISRDLALEQGGHAPALVKSADAAGEILQDPGALGRVRDLGVELHAVPALSSSAMAA